MDSIFDVFLLEAVVNGLLLGGLLALLSLGVVTMLMGARRDLSEAMQQSRFQFEAALLILTAMSAAVGALTVSIPGRERSALVRWLPILAGAGCILWVAGELVLASATGAPTGRPGTTPGTTAPEPTTGPAPRWTPGSGARGRSGRRGCGRRW